MMSADPVLRIFGCDFPDWGWSNRRPIGWYSWGMQIALPAFAGGVALYKKDREGFIRLCIAVIVNQLFLELLKRFIPEQRPNGSSRSFPSGDTAAACVGLAFIVVRYGLNEMPYEIFVMSIIAITVAVSRVLIKAHWVHDVMAGAILGSSVTYLSLAMGKNSGKR